MECSEFHLLSGANSMENSQIFHHHLDGFLLFLFFLYTG